MDDSVSSQTAKKQMQVLTHMQQAISSLGYATHLFETGDHSQPLPGPLLLVGVEKDRSGRDRTLNLSFLPFPDDDDFDYLSLIQCYAPLPFVVPPDRQKEVERLLAGINNRTTVGYFGLTPEGNPFYRYVLALSKWALMETETIQQLLMVFTHLQDRFAPVIEDVAEGKSPAAEQGKDPLVIRPKQSDSPRFF